MAGISTVRRLPTAFGRSIWSAPVAYITGTKRVTDPDRLRAVFPCLMPDSIHYDDQMLRAAQVSMGAMGVIYAVLLDVVQQYSLLQWNAWSTWEQLKDGAGPGLHGLFDGS